MVRFFIKRFAEPLDYPGRIDDRKRDETEGLYRQLLEVQRRTLGDGNKNTIWTMNDLGLLLLLKGDLSEAEHILARGLELSRGNLARRG